MYIKRNRALFISCLIICLVIMGSNSLAKAEMNVHLNIVNSYYIDLDGDNMEDDIVTRFKIKINIDDYNPIDQPYILYIQMMLPSGITYFYEFEVSQNPSPISCIYFYNQAIESGYYTVSITVVVPYEESNYLATSDSLVFDPPGGNGGIEPRARLLI